MCVGTSYDYDYTQKQVNRTPKWVPAKQLRPIRSKHITMVEHPRGPI